MGAAAVTGLILIAAFAAVWALSLLLSRPSTQRGGREIPPQPVPGAQGASRR